MRLEKREFKFVLMTWRETRLAGNALLVLEGLPRHPTQFEPSFLKLKGILWCGERYLSGPGVLLRQAHTL
jgi:hypothetical protein